MSESTSHKTGKKKGLTNAQTEVPIPGGGRLDARDKEVAREVERSGQKAQIKKAIERLNTQKSFKKQLLVPNNDLDKAKELGEKFAKGKLTIQNLGGTKRRFVK